MTSAVLSAFGSFEPMEPATKSRKSRVAISIRLIKESEIPAVMKLTKAASLEFCTTDSERKTTEDFYKSLAKKEKQLIRDCKEGFNQYNRRTWVAVIDHKVIGSIAIKPRLFIKLRDRTVVELHKLCVDPTYRRTGVAQELLATVESYVKSQGIGAIQLTTQSNLKAAMRFYKKSGYTETHHKKWRAFTLHYFRKKIGCKV